MNERPLLVPHHDVRQAITVDVARDHLRAHAGIVIDEIRDEIHALVRAPRQLEPIEHRLVIAIRITRASVRPETFTRHDILHAIAIHIDEIDRVNLRELHAVFILLQLLVHEDVLAELDLRALAHLLIPRQPEAMRAQPRDDVIQPVTIHVVGIHLRTAHAHRLRVKGPHRIAHERRRLFPPTILLQQIHPPIAIDVPHAHAVREILILVVRRDRVKGPRLLRRAPIRRGIAVNPLRDAHQLRLPIPRDVRKRRRLVIRLRENLVPLPMTVLPLRILEPRRVLPGESDN